MGLAALRSLIDSFADALRQLTDFKVRIEGEEVRQGAQSARIADQLKLANGLAADGGLWIAQALQPQVQRIAHSSLPS